MKKLGFLVLSSQALLLSGFATESGPQAVGTIPPQAIYAGGVECGTPDNLNFDLTPYFDAAGEPITYCLSSLSCQGDTTNLVVTLDPYTGILTIPVGWFAAGAVIDLNIVAKNPYGNAMQHMTVSLNSCDEWEVP